jgi:hypothetical protein
MRFMSLEHLFITSRSKDLYDKIRDVDRIRIYRRSLLTDGRSAHCDLKCLSDVSLQGFLPFGEHIDEGPYYLPHDGGSLFSGASPYMEAGLLTQRPHEDFFNNASVRALIKPQDDPFWTGNSKMTTATPIDDIHLAGALGNRPSGASLTIASSDLYPGYHTFQVPTSSTQDSISIGSGQLGQMACIESPSFDVDTFFEPGQGGSTHDHQDTSDNYEFTDTKFQHPHDPRSETHGHGQQRKLHRARSRSPVVCQTCGTKSKNPSDARYA